MSTTPVPKKKRGPKPTGWGVQIQVRLHDADLSDVDAYRAKHPGPDGKPISRPEAIRRLMRVGLGGD